MRGRALSRRQVGSSNNVRQRVENCAVRGNCSEIGYLVWPREARRTRATWDKKREREAAGQRGPLENTHATSRSVTAQASLGRSGTRHQMGLIDAR